MHGIATHHGWNSLVNMDSVLKKDDVVPIIEDGFTYYYVRDYKTLVNNTADIFGIIEYLTKFSMDNDKSEIFTGIRNCLQY